MFETNLDQPRGKVFDQEKITHNFDQIIRSEVIQPQVIEGENGPIGFFCHKGLSDKKYNEDTLVINQRVNAFASIDGMGGAGGPYDGKKAADILASQFKKFFQKGWDLDKVRILASQEMLKNGVIDGGACYLAGKITNDLLEIYQAGDARLIVINKNNRVNFETKDERPEGKARHLVTNCVQGKKAGDVNYYKTGLEFGDRIIVASDGLWDNLSTEQVVHIVQKRPTGEALKRLNEMSLAKMRSSVGKADNINVLIYDYLKPSPKISLSQAQNFGELYKIINQIGQIEGSEYIYSGKDLIKIINLVRQGKAPPKAITRTEGLRKKVENLLWTKS